MELFQYQFKNMPLAPTGKQQLSCSITAVTFAYNDARQKTSNSFLKRRPWLPGYFLAFHSEAVSFLSVSLPWPICLALFFGLVRYKAD